jgi:hypothetical protein
MLRAWVFVVLAAVVCHAQETADRQSERLVGPVKIVTGERWTEDRSARRATAPGDRKPIDTVTFDAAGRVATRDIIDDYGFPVGRETSTYAGARLQTRVLRDPKGKLLERRTYRYTTGDRPVAQVITGGDGASYEEQYTRGAGGRLERTTYVQAGVERGHTEYRYGGGAEPTEVAYFTRRDTPATAPVGPCLGAHRLTFRRAGDRVVDQALFDTDGTSVRRSTFEYDAHGNVAREVRTEPHGVIRVEHAYEYDARRNWTSRRVTIERDGERSPLISVMTRTLTYY